jgi:DNA-binding NarL/FixJ family response regulator
MSTGHNKLPPAADADDELPPLVVTSFDDLNFMVIDDNGPGLALMERLLKAVAVRSISTADNAFAAVGMLASKRIKADCIICEHKLEGGLTGLALLKRIRAGRNSVIPRDTRFILATDHPQEDLVQTAIRLDVSGLLTKPTNGAGVLKAIHLALGRNPRLKPVAEYAKVVLPA